jgi:hypothetical protein
MKLRTLRAIITGGGSKISDIATDKAGITSKLEDPLRLMPRRPVVTQYVTGSGGNPSERRRAGMQSGLIGISRLTG